jgi:K+-sensing histidine kinase KdpD
MQGRRRKRCLQMLSFGPSIAYADRTMTEHYLGLGVGGMSEISRRWLWPGTAATLLVALTTLVMLPVYLVTHADHLGFAYLIPTTLIAVRYGSGPALLAIAASDFCAAYFLYPPDYSIYISDPLQVAELSFFSLLALATSQFVGGLADDERLRRRAGSLQ